MDTSLAQLSYDDYTVACICPMGVELAAMEAMLDSTHKDLVSRRDQSVYTAGRIGVHNVVIAVLPETGNNQAANVATQLLNDFRSIRFGLLVGIGGGIPNQEHDIRLGDIVVSKSTSTFGGVVQYDRGKVTDGGLFERTGSLGPPPTILRVTVNRLQSQHARLGSEVPKYLRDMTSKYPNMAEGQYVFQGSENDLLFEEDYSHQKGGTCEQCDVGKLVKRNPRTNDKPKIHYGTIGSANVVVKDATTRRRLKEQFDLLCVEMEAAGLMDDFPCLVIRGICDYADSHKNKRWQPYAAATAAAYAKELLSLIPGQEISRVPKAAEEREQRNINAGNTYFINHGKVGNQANVQNIAGDINF